MNFTLSLFCLILAMGSFVLAPVSVHAQYTVTGNVFDDETGKPLPGASVYINGSTVGTISNEKGEFVLPSVGVGLYEVIASYVGYTVLVYRATIQSTGVRITFRLQKKQTALRNIVVLTKDGRAKWIRIFKENFLGITDAANRCSMINQEEVLFADGASRKTINAFSAVPLEIINKELGYRIFFQLEDFYFNEVEGRTYFYGYSRFEELSEKKEVPGRYLRNRERYYRGSTMHFFHSLIDNKIKEEGFLLLNIRSSEPIDSMPKKNGPALSISGRSDSSVQIRRSPKMNIGYPVAPSQFLVRDTTDQKNVYIMNWKEKLRVTYSKNPFSKRYLQKKVFLQGGLPTGVWSDVEMLESPVYMDPNGSLYNPLAIQVSGYWSYEKVATMLPINYRPR